MVNDRSDALLGAKIATDGQWRFPPIDTVPSNFVNAILVFEDKRFYDHVGVDIVALGRAMVQNVKAGRIKSGASTISMQVIRLARKGKPRTIYQKIIEVILATRLELKYSKREILEMYASHAPFGGNVVGLEAACWRYYQKDPEHLSIAEAATLAVLPNAPSLIHLSRSRDRLVEKRNRLLERLRMAEIISERDYELSLLEPIPPKPFALPALAPHLLEHLDRMMQGEMIQSSIDAGMQQLVTNIADQHCAVNQQSDIHNIGIIVVDNETAEVLSYVGNANNARSEKAVDMIQAKRSSGSILKPLLYAQMIEEGQILPHSLVTDIPMQFAGFAPENYNKRYSGATPADEALSKSLNVPAVLSLKNYGVDKFLSRLRDHGISSLEKDEEHYGLSLILGGGEVSLWDLSKVFSNMAAVLLGDTSNNRTLDRKLLLQKMKGDNVENSGKQHFLSAGAIYRTFEAMTQLIRPRTEGGWQQYDSSKPIAWKTGTSYGHRDAWAVGVASRYTIGVWVGNADGEPKNGLLGVSKAGQVLFDLVGRLEIGPFFAEPVDDLPAVVTCSDSGYLVSPSCSAYDTIFAPVLGMRSPMCPYHRTIHLDTSGFRVNSECEEIADMIQTSWFELPPVMAHYYQRSHADYMSIPRYRTDCLLSQDTEVISFIYPSMRAQIYLPTNGSGQVEGAVFRAAHADPKAEVHWHLDDAYLGSTREVHHMMINTSRGEHTITIVDLLGNEAIQYFEII